MGRPSWTDYYLGLALLVSQRSHDIHTQHGCIITDQDHRVLGVGYNGFPAGLPDDELPVTRPEKYDWMIHSEINAVTNCIHKPVNGVAYVTGQCCNNCIKHLYNNGVKRVVMLNRHGSFLLDETTKKHFDEFVEKAAKKGFQIEYVDPDLSWVRQAMGVIDSITK